MITCRLEKVLFTLIIVKIIWFWQWISFWVREANFKYFLMGEKPGESWDIIFSKNLKKCFFQALAKPELEKIILNFAQKSIFWKIVYPQNNHQEVVSATSNAKKWILRIILKLFSPGNFFHTTFSFGPTGP